MQSVKEIIDQAGGIDTLLEIARLEPERRADTLFDLEPVPGATGPDEQEKHGPPQKSKRRKSRAA
jgi:hypothetical protein